MVKGQKYLEEKRKETGLLLVHSESIRLESLPLSLSLIYTRHMSMSDKISNFLPKWLFNKLTGFTEFEEKYVCQSCQTLELQDSHTLNSLGHYTAEYEIRYKMNNHE